MNSFRDYLAEAEGKTTHYLIQMSKDGDDQHFVVDYTIGPNSEGHPLGLKRTINQDDRVEELLAQGYKQPDVIAQWRGDIDAAIEDYRNRAESWSERRKEFPAQYYGAVRKAEELERAKSILSGTVEEDQAASDEYTAMMKLSGLNS